MQIKKQIIADTKYSIKCPYKMNVQWIVIHNTANDASAQNEVQYMQSNDKAVSYHFAVDDQEIIQALPLDRNGWHAGDGHRINGGNMSGIAIEICYSKSGGERFIQAEKNAAWLAAKLLNDYHLDISHLKKHQDFANKDCPHRTLNLGWDRFVKMVQSHLSQTTVKTASKQSLSNPISYYPQYNGKTTSLVDALKSLNIPSSQSDRKRIAVHNGINQYSGTSEQNQKMLNLLKQGQLKK